MDWTEPTGVRIHWLGFLNTVMKFLDQLSKYKRLQEYLGLVSNYL